MHPRIAELISYLDRQHDATRRFYESIPADQRSRRPRANAWSPSDIVTHLTLAESRIGGLLAKLVADAKASGLGPETDASPILPTLDLSRILDRTGKIVASAAIDPIQTPATAQWGDYDAARASVRSAVISGDGLALGAIQHPHPVFGPYTLYQWVAFVAAHEARHTEQMKEAVRG